MTNNDIWRIFSAQQEYNAPYTDAHGRFPYELNTHPVFIPTVSKYLFENGFRPAYPDGAKLAVCVSHDIDILYHENISFVKFIKSFIKGAVTLNSRSVGIAFEKYFRKRIPEYSVDTILNLNSSYKIKSTYFFLALEKGEEEFNYSLRDIQEVTDKIFKSGCEIGLHGGFGAYNNSARLLEEKKRLEDSLSAKVTAYRNHYLKFKIPDTWNILSGAGFIYDTTYGFAPSVGFRNGMCFPFHPYDLQSDRFIPIYEIPLIVMDGSFFLKKYMNLSFEEAFKYFILLIEEVEKVNGVFTLLWHNTFFQNEYLEFYKRIIEYLKVKKCWFCTGNELINWWEKQGYHTRINKLLLEIRGK